MYTTEYYSAIKKNKILPPATTWMDLEGIMLSEISQTNVLSFHLYVEYKKKKTEQMNKQNRNKIHRYKLAVWKREGEIGKRD